MSSARIEELRKKFDENPRRYFAPLANEYRKAGDFDQAIFICQEYLPQQPGHMSGHIVFGQALFEAKRLPEAKTVFETALSLDPENLIALRHLADISRGLGDTVAAKGWYERVLQADPRNDEVVEIMAQLGSAPAEPPAAAVSAAAAPTAESPARAPATKTLPDASSAPTMELSAAAVQEMLKQRQAAKAPPEPPRPTLPEPAIEPMTLDATPTVEVHAVESTALDGLEGTSAAGTPAGTMEGLEPTSFGGMDLPTIEPLGLEGNTAPGAHADEPPPPAALDGLDTIPLDISLPGAPSAPPPAPATLEIPAVPSADDGLLDLDSFSVGGEAPAAAAPSPVETPIDGGHDDGGLIDLDFEAPAASTPEPPKETSIPTMIIDAVKTVVPAVQDAVESAAPAMLDFVDTTIPAVVDTVKSAVEAVAETPTVVMEAIKAPAKAEPPAPAVPPAEPPAAPRTSQSVPFVTETMAQLYLSQGHRAEAIDIYRKLIEARPSDKELKARLAAIESEPQTPAAAPAPAAPTPTPTPTRYTGSGPSIRTVLRELFGFDGSAVYATAVAATVTPGVPAEVGSIDMLFSRDDVSDSLNPLAVAFDGGYVASQGSIDDLFGAGR